MPNKKARPNEVRGSIEPGSKKGFNKFIAKGNRKIKRDEELIIIGPPGHRYYSAAELRDANIRIFEERGTLFLRQDSRPGRKLNLTAEEIRKKLKGERHARKQKNR